MSSRIFSIGICIAAAACGGPPESVAPGNVQQVGSGNPADLPAERIACAVDDGDYAEVCTVDRTTTTAGTMLTIRHADGGFRRLRIAANGDVIAADGAQPARVIARNDDALEVAIGGARYRLPSP